VVAAWGGIYPRTTEPLNQNIWAGGVTGTRQRRFARRSQMQVQTLPGPPGSASSLPFFSADTSFPRMHADFTDFFWGARAVVGFSAAGRDASTPSRDRYRAPRDSAQHDSVWKNQNSWRSTRWELCCWKLRA